MGDGVGVGSWAGMGLINYDWIDYEFISLVLCLNCANMHVPCCNWLRINTIYKSLLTMIIRHFGGCNYA